MATELVGLPWSNQHQLYAAVAALVIGFLYRAYAYTLDLVIDTENEHTAQGSKIGVTYPTSPARPKLVHSAAQPPATIIPVSTGPCSPPRRTSSTAGRSSHTVIELVTLEEAEKSAWDDDEFDEEFDSLSDDGSDGCSEPPSPLFDRLVHFPTPPITTAKSDYLGPIFVDLPSLRAPLRTHQLASQRVQKMISARMSAARAGGQRHGAKSDQLRRAVLENEGRREARRIDEERWERSRRAWEDDRRQGLEPIGAFDV